MSYRYSKSKEEQLDLFDELLRQHQQTIAAPTTPPNHHSVPQQETNRARKPQRKASAIIRGADIDAAAPHFNRIFSISLLILSFTGTIVAINGQWPNPWWAIWACSTTAIVGGFIIQIVCTGAEWTWRNNKLSLPYAGAYTIDIAGTVAGFGPLFAPGIAASLIAAHIAQDLAYIITWGFIVVFSAWIAYYPEASLVD
jgi:hypothetical protein